MARPLLVERKIALCYIRLSVTKDASDLTSPERQRSNIEAACKKYGWSPEWYEDAKGHKSATKEENRPACLTQMLSLFGDLLVALEITLKFINNPFLVIYSFLFLSFYLSKLGT